MKKRLMAMLALAALTATTLTACGGSSSSGDSSTGSGSSDSSSSSSSSTGGTVKIICPYGVGGTADAIARKYALVAGKHSDYNFIVENMTGGDGFAAAAYYTDLDSSTKELLVYGYGVSYRHDIGSKYGTEVVDFDRSEIYPIATIDDRTWIMYTTPGTTVEELLAKAKDGGLKMSGGNPLSDPHLALGSLIAQEGGSLMVVPYDGGANQKKGLTDGEVDVFVGTTQAAQDDVAAGLLIPVLAFSDTSFTGFVGPDGDIEVPTIAGDAKHPALNASTDYSGSILPAGGFISTRTGADQAWIDEMVEISKAVWADAEYADWIDEILLNKFELYDDDAYAYLNQACEKAMLAFETLSN